MATAELISRLTPEEVAHLETFGFIVLRGLFSPEEMEAIGREFNELTEEDRQGQPFKGEKRQQVYGFCERRPLLMQIVDDERIYEPLERLLGPDFMFWSSVGNLFVGNKSWHPDGSPRSEAEFDYNRVKIGFYLDPLRKDTGCLCVIPGSHKKPFHDEIMPHLNRPDRSVKPFGVGDADLPAFALETDPGDVILFNQNLWHASFGGGIGRRMLSLSYFANPTTEDHIGYLRWNYTNAFKHMKGWSHTQRDHVHEEAFLNSDRPRIKRMVAELVELRLK